MEQGPDVGMTNATALVVAIENYDHYPRLVPVLEAAVQQTTSTRSYLYEPTRPRQQTGDLSSPAPPGWYAIPLRLIVGFGVMQHGYAKLARGPEHFINLLHAMGIPGNY